MLNAFAWSALPALTSNFARELTVPIPTAPANVDVSDVLVAVKYAALKKLVDVAVSRPPLTSRK